MPSKPVMIAIDWFGPYRSLKAASKAACRDYDAGLYLALGTRRGGRSQIDYMGISGNLGQRLSRPHHVLSKMTIAQIWLGEVVTAEPSGRKLKVTQATLDYAEWLHVHFMQLEHNDRKRLNPPSRPANVLNRWWKTDYETPRRNRPHPDWPDLIDHPIAGRPSRMVWFGGRQQIF